MGPRKLRRMVHGSSRCLRVIVLGALGALGCATAGGSEGPTRINDDTYRVRCDAPLATCLARFSSCPKGFTVVEGRETRDRRGPEPLPDVSVDSEAVLRCRRVALLGGSRDDQTSATPPAGERTAVPATCFPGSTQACLGPAACSGAQTCLPGGAAFGPCDCGARQGPEAAPPASPPPAGPAAPVPPPAPAHP
jgi:hypothetical protein